MYVFLLCFKLDMYSKRISYRDFLLVINVVVEIFLQILFFFLLHVFYHIFNVIYFYEGRILP
ncbi:hypothetical protein H8356DRAFT_1434479 [Neocallimastix lanati (nom. inval.)]|nr:hypothetical protein H8356DRAFT_1434479 [Neocallimastix sp. JGI-2020a]